MTSEEELSAFSSTNVPSHLVFLLPLPCRHFYPREVSKLVSSAPNSPHSGPAQSTCEERAGPENRIGVLTPEGRGAGAGQTHLSFRTLSPLTSAWFPGSSLTTLSQHHTIVGVQWTVQKGSGEFLWPVASARLMSLSSPLQGTAHWVLALFGSCKTSLQPSWVHRHPIRGRSLH